MRRLWFYVYWQVRGRVDVAIHFLRGSPGGRLKGVWGLRPTLSLACNYQLFPEIREIEEIQQASKE